MATARKALRVLWHQYRTLPFSKFLALLRTNIYRDDRIFIYAVRLADCREDPRESISIEQGRPEDLAAARAVLPKVPWELQCDVYDQVTDFFIHKTESGGIAHISWLYYERDPNRLLRLGPDEAEAKFGLTFPEFRGRGMVPAAFRTMQAYLKRQGFRRMLTCVKDDNHASIRAIEKSGFRRVGVLNFRKLLGVQVSRKVDTKTLHDPAG